MGQLANAVNMETSAIRANARHKQPQARQAFSRKISALIRRPNESLRSQLQVVADWVADALDGPGLLTFARAAENAPILCRPGPRRYTPSLAFIAQGNAMSRDLQTDIANVFSRMELNRRHMLASSLAAAGFALAVQPIGAATITTDASGLDAGDVKIPVGDETIPGYRATPAKGGPFPVILVVQEIFGVHEHIKDICRRFAKLGYFAIAPELYYRQGDVSKLKTIDEIRPIVAKVPDAQVMADLDAAVDLAQKSGKGDVAKLGVTGFCWGGRIVWLYAAHSKQLKAGVAWYGRLVGDPTENQPQHPVNIAAELKAPVLGLYGGKDQGIPLDTVEQMRAALKKARVPSEIIVYPNAPHAFFADYRPSFVEADAKDAWGQALAWFKQHGVA
jgi:carboxymethylenebutenolidase